MMLVVTAVKHEEKKEGEQKHALSSNNNVKGKGSECKQEETRIDIWEPLVCSIIFWLLLSRSFCVLGLPAGLGLVQRSVARSTQIGRVHLASSLVSWAHGFCHLHLTPTRFLENRSRGWVAEGSSESGQLQKVCFSLTTQQPDVKRMVHVVVDL